MNLFVPTAPHQKLRSMNPGREVMRTTFSYSCGIQGWTSHFQASHIFMIISFSAIKEKLLNALVNKEIRGSKKEEEAFE